MESNQAVTQEIDPNLLVRVPHVIEATDAAALANQVGLYRLANPFADSNSITYLVHPNGGFLAIIETYIKASNLIKGEING